MSGLVAFTLFHVLISLVGIVAGFGVVLGWVSHRERPKLTMTFLVTTVLTSLTGFGFPFTRFLPSHAFGAVSLVLLPLAGIALYAFELRGVWRRVYTVCALLALYLNVFVLVVQLFAKVPALRVAAPTQTELPFALAQGAVLLLFVGIGWVTLRRPKASALPARAT
ncbi:MAG TPA: hypothetical protein VNN80_29395 [Polyangiaceae bacterium]|jgi:hypothetical protein|nr:hypothetical protein [Polyangiaceae bacterium]